MPFLEIQDVNKCFGGLQALANVNLQVEEGAIHAIIGPNGAGKSTLLNLIIGQLKPDKGTVYLGGRPVIGVNPYDGTRLRVRKPSEIMQLGLARVFQTPQIFPALSLAHNVAISGLANRDGRFSLKALENLDSNHPVMEEALLLLSRMGLDMDPETQADHLSRGDKRRLELAACLASHPRLLLLDEPTAGMSRHDTNMIIELLRDIHATGMTMLVIEHDMHVVFSLAERITVLAQGQTISAGSPGEVRADPKVKAVYLGGAA
ncbi:MAG: ABC transporter ATP-binding protein [Desulfovibrio sp.]|nr:MAG: ABC transporter ATP-binding protein [Desulfovibrio sp.]